MNPHNLLKTEFTGDAPFTMCNDSAVVSEALSKSDQQRGTSRRKWSVSHLYTPPSLEYLGPSDQAD